MTKRLFIACLVLVAGLFTPIAAQKVRKETLEFEGKKRTYYLLVPATATPQHPVPVVMLLHGSGRDGMSLMDKWKDLANKEGFIAVAPDAITSEGWRAPIDGPDFLHELLSAVKAQYPIDSRRMYLFGHSGGASFALYMALYESEYFAAAAIHAGALRPEDEKIIRLATRKIPMHIAVGDRDQFFPLAAVRATRDALVANGFQVGLTEMKGHDHWYYDLAPKINTEAWDFLKQQKLTDEPRYIQYAWK
ncbi:MAG TPA: alpha/beta hydrolase-fold protein [Pyrinomonadaceae bacterium]|nr:alpha/beta hydrolase-fold protein [Pyrinomonadaceae bacterium]